MSDFCQWRGKRMSWSSLGKRNWSELLNPRRAADPLPLPFPLALVDICLLGVEWKLKTLPRGVMFSCAERTKRLFPPLLFWQSLVLMSRYLTALNPELCKLSSSECLELSTIFSKMEDCRLTTRRFSLLDREMASKEISTFRRCLSCSWQVKYEETKSLLN